MNWQMLLMKTLMLNGCPGLVVSSWLMLVIMVFKHSGWRGGAGKWPPNLPVRSLQHWKYRIPHTSPNVLLSRGCVYHWIFAFPFDSKCFVFLPAKGRGSEIILVLEGDSFSTALCQFHRGIVPQFCIFITEYLMSLSFSKIYNYWLLLSKISRSGKTFILIIRIVILLCSQMQWLNLLSSIQSSEERGTILQVHRHKLHTVYAENAER